MDYLAFFNLPGDAKTVVANRIAHSVMVLSPEAMERFMASSIIDRTTLEAARVEQMFAPGLRAV